MLILRVSVQLLEVSDVDTNLNVSGIATVGIVSAANFYVSGVSTVATTLNVGAGGSVLNASTSNSRVGINSTVPAYALDVIGDINSSTAVNIKRQRVDHCIQRCHRSCNCSRIINNGKHF